jgi:hypothetical protein
VASQLYNRQSGAARQALEDDLRQSDEALEVASTAEREYAAEEWNNLSGSDRLQYATDHGFATGIKLRPGEPGEWKFDSDREEDEPETDEDYLRTRAIGLELVKDRTEAVMQARGVLSKDVTPDKIAGDLWHAWKTDSQSPLGLAMQIAVADELGTLPTASITAADRTAAEAAMVAAFTTAEEREKLHPSSSALIKTIDALPADQQADAWRKAEALEKTEKNAITTLAKTRVQAYARAQWETTQFLLQKAGADRVQMYRAIIRPAEEVNNTTRVPYAEGVRLPDYQLKHNAVASATTKPKVANEWNGVGVKVEQGKRERVVLRFDAPRTAVFSLPVYGQNVHAESEVVLIGTKGLKWDAWHQKGPGFDTRRIDMASFKLEVTVESDDTPDDTEKTPSVKKDGPVIDLLKDQDEHWLAPDHYRKPPQKIPTPKPETT